jgi:hypothetical protein
MPYDTCRNAYRGGREPPLLAYNYRTVRRLCQPAVETFVPTMIEILPPSLVGFLLGVRTLNSRMLALTNGDI